MKRNLDVYTIINRIKSATKNSPIAVFRVPNGLDAMFANTAKTQDMLNDSSLIGIYDNTMDIPKIWMDLGRLEARL